MTYRDPVMERLMREQQALGDGRAVINTPGKRPPGFFTQAGQLVLANKLNPLLAGTAGAGLGTIAASSLLYNEGGSVPPEYDPFPAGYFSEGGRLSGWNADYQRDYTRGPGERTTYSINREAKEEEGEPVHKVQVGDQSSGEDSWGRPWGHPEYGKSPSGDGSIALTGKNAASAGLGAAGLLGFVNPLVALGGGLLLNKDKFSDIGKGVKKFGKDTAHAFSKEGREEFYDRMDADRGRREAGWGDYYEDADGNIQQKHATWRDFTRALSGETDWGGRPTNIPIVESGYHEEAQGGYTLPGNEAPALPTDHSDYYTEAQGGSYENPADTYATQSDASESFWDSSSADFINKGGMVNYRQGGGVIGSAGSADEQIMAAMQNLQGAQAAISGMEAAASGDADGQPTVKQTGGKGGGISSGVSSISNNAANRLGSARAAALQHEDTATTQAFNNGGQVQSMPVNPNYLKQGGEVCGPLSKVVHKNAGGEVAERHYYNPMMAKK